MKLCIPFALSFFRLYRLLFYAHILAFYPLCLLSGCTDRGFAWKWSNVALFFRLAPSSTLIRHENRAFWKRSSNRWNLKTPVLLFSLDGKHFETKVFKEDGFAIIMCFPWPSFPQTKIQINEDICVFKFLRRSVNGTTVSSLFLEYSC